MLGLKRGSDLLVCDERELTLEALLIRYVKDQEDTHGSSVVGSSDGTESLLSCCVPLKRRQKEDGECMECQLMLSLRLLYSSLSP